MNLPSPLWQQLRNPTPCTRNALFSQARHYVGYHTSPPRLVRRHSASHVLPRFKVQYSPLPLLILTFLITGLGSSVLRSRRRPRPIFLCPRPCPTRPMHTSPSLPAQHYECTSLECNHMTTRAALIVSTAVLLPQIVPLVHPNFNCPGRSPSTRALFSSVASLEFSVPLSAREILSPFSVEFLDLHTPPARLKFTSNPPTPSPLIRVLPSSVVSHPSADTWPSLLLARKRILYDHKSTQFHYDPHVEPRPPASRA